MSGDVQPRKRKDKRRRRDDDEGSATAQSVPLVRTGSTADHSDNVTIHVYKEAGTGGHWCARIVFFALLAALLGLVGLIILEHRGTSDVDTPVTASQWAMIFDGWVDEAPAQHDDEHEVAAHEESREEDECSKPDEEVAEEPAGPDKTISEEETDEGLGDDLDDDDDDDDDDDEPEPREDEDADEESNNDETEDDYASPEKDDQDEDEGYSKEESDDDQADDDLGAFEEVEDDDVNDDDAQDENLADAAFDSDLDFSIEGIRAAADEDHEFQSFIEGADNAEEYISIPGVNEIDDNSAEPLEEIDGEDPEEIANEVNNEEEDEEEEKAKQMLEEESTSVAMKFGVGIALIVTAHFVLVRRWNNGDADAPEILTNSDEVPNLSRRNTLVPPGRIKEVDLKNSDKKTLNKAKEQTYEDLRSTYKTIKKKTDVENIFSKKTADLQAILFGESKDSKTNLSVENTERQTEEDEYSEGENDFEDDEEYDEEDMEEDYEDEGEEEEEEEEDVEDVDDTELVEKLDKKYGKLPTPPYSDQDDEEEEEEEEDREEEEEVDEDEEEEEEVDEDEEEDDELDGWKRVKAPTPGDQVMENSKKSESKPKSGGQQGGNYFDDSLEDLRITEETDSISSKVPVF
ncbi:hypothetical protein TSAR_005380 [Trichomalopsis sarcophagae]|uniref:Uncharacterized protein n=1 Tax=Trichomalopsis sarcophagae TaxID=543379 RepID=A0A232EKE1_9HYME|nr:hypothetical protein TSAR_005380 [Trichomalopsis sarcophagae]